MSKVSIQHDTIHSFPEGTPAKKHMTITSVSQNRSPNIVHALRHAFDKANHDSPSLVTTFCKLVKFKLELKTLKHTDE